MPATDKRSWKNTVQTLPTMMTIRSNHGEGCDAYSSEDFINLASKPNESELFLHPPDSPLSIVTENDEHLAPSTSFLSKNCSTHENIRNVTTDWCQITLVDCPEKSSINSDITLSYIEKMLMQEDIDEKVRLYDGDAALQAMEEPFYKLLGQKYTVFPQQQPFCGCNHLKNLDVGIAKSNGQSCNICSTSKPANVGSSISSNGNFQGFQFPWSLSAIAREEEQFTQHSKRMDDGLKVDGLSITEKPRCDDSSLQMNAKCMSKHALFEVHGRKSYPCIDLDLLEGRSNKQHAIYSDEPIRDEMFDEVLLYPEHKPLDEGISLHEAMNNSSKSSQIDQERTSARRKARGRRQQKKDVVDLRTLLIHCAQAVAVSNHSLASDILKTIKQHASPNGDDSQRLAFCLAYSLEVRLAGTGSQIYDKFITKQRNVVDILKGKSRVHIIDFGICFGFQWPSLFQQLANREDGPPKLRITGIELPQPGFRPNEMSKNTGLRLADYASMFNIPFEYQHISSKWEVLSVEDFNIEKDDVLIVNCIHRMKYLGDETISINSARNRVLNTIRMMKPKIFVQGVLNGSYGGIPFFLTRFKEVMYHYTSLFDMLDKTIPRGNETRMIIERGIYQSAILNVIACEGQERIDRPESYKKWKVRNLKAGLLQLPLNLDIVEETQNMVRKNYHKDFLVDEEDQWLVMGWKGRVIYAISTWKPNEPDDSD